MDWSPQLGYEWWLVIITTEELIYTICADSESNTTHNDRANTSNINA